MYTLHPPPIVHNGNIMPKPYHNGNVAPRPFSNGNVVPRPFSNGNVTPKPFSNGSLSRNFTNRHSLNPSSTPLPTNFNLNLNKRRSMPANSVPPNNAYNVLHNVVRQRQQQFEQQQQQKQKQQQQRVNQAYNHANRKVRAVGMIGDENGFVVTIPASDKPTQLFVRIPDKSVEGVPDFILNSQVGLLPIIITENIIDIYRKN